MINFSNNKDNIDNNDLKIKIKHQKHYIVKITDTFIIVITMIMVKCITSYLNNMTLIVTITVITIITTTNENDKNNILPWTGGRVGGGVQRYEIKRKNTFKHMI